MKKKIIIISLLSVAILAIGAYFLFKSKRNTLAQYIPKEALFVAKIDLFSMGQKIKFKELADFKFYKDMMKEFKSDSKNSVDKIIESPQESGISLLQSPYFFAFNTTKERAKPGFTIAFGISDKDKFTKFFKQITEGNYEIKDAGKFASAKIGGGSRLYFNDDVGFLVNGAGYDEAPYNLMVEKFFELSKSESILSNDGYENFQKRESDLSVYINKKAIKTLLENEGSFGGSDKKMIEQAMNYYPIGVTLSFDEDVIKLKSYADPESKSSGEIYKPDGLKDNDLKLLAPNGKPIAFMSVNTDIKKLYELINYNGEFSSQMNEMASSVGLTSDNLLSILNGTITASLSDITKKDAYDYTGTMIGSRPAPIFVIHAGLNNTGSYDQLISKIGSNFTNNNGVFSVNYDTYNNESVYFMRKDRDLLISNDKNYLEDFRSGKSWSILNEDNAKKEAADNPMSFYMDLKYKSYENYIDSYFKYGFVDASKMDGIKSLLSNFKDIKSYSNKDEGTMLIEMEPNKTNSLWRLFLLTEDFYKRGV